MSRKFTIKIAGAEWSGSDTMQILCVANTRVGYVVKDKRKLVAHAYGRSDARRFPLRSMSSAKRYVIRQLAKPEKQP